MENKRILELLEIERECIRRNSDGECDRNCGYCDLVQEDNDILELCDSLIGMVKEMTKSESRDCSEAVPFPVFLSELPRVLCWHCGYCGATITDGDKFCKNCGKEVKWK